MVDPCTGNGVPVTLWGEIKPRWNIDARKWSVHIAVPDLSQRPALDPDLNATGTIAVRYVVASLSSAFFGAQTGNLVPRHLWHYVESLTAHDLIFPTVEDGADRVTPKYSS